MVAFQNISLSFQGRTIFQNLNLEFSKEKTTMIMGPSGCGKTTCLRLLAGLIKADSGNILFNEKNPDLSFLPQNPALLPWLNVEQNILLVLQNKKEYLPLVHDWISKVELQGFEKNYPAELSGGMCQRVALARSLCVDRPLLLLDEPFQGLDQNLHQRMLSLVQESAKGKTVIFTTHDPTDRSIADDIITFQHPNDNTPLVVKTGV